MNQLLQNKLVRRLLVYPLLMVAASYTAYLIAYPICSLRYKLTAEILTPDGMKMGSTIIEVAYSSSHPLPNPGRWPSRVVTGEALFVDLGEGKNLFILLGSDKWERRSDFIPPFGGELIWKQESLNNNSMRRSFSASILPLFAYQVDHIPGQERAMAATIAALKGETQRSIPIENLPAVGTFGDLEKPETFQHVDPRILADYFGQGFSLKSVTIEITEEMPGIGLAAMLEWLNSNPTSRLTRCGAIPIEVAPDPCRVWVSNFKAFRIKDDYIN